ncbi:hypothetical protein HT105_24610, partial [Bacteroides fragilis]|nr:hypothetical protein [Bacteroides fragilis]
AGTPGTIPHEEWRDYHRTEQGVTLDLETFWARRGDSITYIRNLMAKTTTNPAQFDCFAGTPGTIPHEEWRDYHRTEQGVTLDLETFWAR